MNGYPDLAEPMLRRAAIDAARQADEAARTHRPWDTSMDSLTALLPDTATITPEIVDATETITGKPVPAGPFNHTVPATIRAQLRRWATRTHNMEVTT